MIYAITVLSATVLILLIAVIFLTLKCVDLNTSFNSAYQQLVEKEENFYRAQRIVKDKFGFLIPGSRFYLEVAEKEMQEQLRKGQDNV